MSEATWKKSSFCGEGESCIHLAAGDRGTIRLTETSDPSGAVLTLAPTTWRAWQEDIRLGRVPDGGETGPDGTLRLRTHPQGPVVTTTTPQWEAFAAGVRAGEFDRLAG
ncbi:DUF397 domain-containing protein [Streptomyces sp. MUM 203J]|uniref:DUF397 domain-containing protein n=1 Tax=Streptomyces sp. MUM 203J TaxID=2791990 RepID=UPI001F042247|nr:DUF397 domain-containing protein [Streptomyces sp. MUM 203J]MCH0538499.1 DUF397 domain-containing protein [Streptomyces sp. MUM 203J]